MSGPILSNRLTDLAERAGEAFRRGQARTIEAAADYLETGRLLAEAKAECGHGQWLPFLARAGIPVRTAQRMTRLAASGLSAETLAAQGIRATLAGMGRPEKNDTVSHLKPGSASGTSVTDGPKDKRRSLYRERRAAGLCVVCGAPANGKARCTFHAGAVARQDRQRRALAVMGRKLAPRIAAAANAGQGVRLSAAEAAELAGMIGRKAGT